MPTLSSRRGRAPSSLNPTLNCNSGVLSSGDWARQKFPRNSVGPLAGESLTHGGLRRTQQAVLAVAVAGMPSTQKVGATMVLRARRPRHRCKPAELQTVLVEKTD